MHRLARRNAFATAFDPDVGWPSTRTVNARALVQVLRGRGNAIERLELAALLFLEALAVDDFRRADQVRAVATWALRRSWGTGATQIRAARDELLESVFTAQGMHRLPLWDVVADPERSETLVMAPLDIEAVESAEREALSRRREAWRRVGRDAPQNGPPPLQLPQVQWW